MTRAAAVPSFDPSVLAPALEAGDCGEQRREARPRTLLSGKLVFGLHDLTADCTVRNLSGGGAKIQTSLAAELPHDFWLIVIKQGMAYRASIAWRNHDTLGLRFEAAHDLSAERDPKMAIVRHVWRQLADR